MSNGTSAKPLVLKYTVPQQSSGCSANLVAMLTQGQFYSVPFDISTLPASITLTTTKENNFQASAQVTLLPDRQLIGVPWVYRGTLSATVFGQAETITQVVLVGSGTEPSGWSSEMMFGPGCVVATGPDVDISAGGASNG